jgi:DNA-binding LacI/PurR family transcriptional regulator
VPARDAAMDGAVIYSCDPDTSAADWLVRRGLPLVTVDQKPLPHIASVNVDDHGGGCAAAAHLLELGHRRIAVVTTGDGPAGVAARPTVDAVAGKYVSRERLAGYLDALGPAGVRPLVHVQHDNSEDEAYEAALVLLRREDPPTAVLCNSDVLAVGVLHAAEELGLDVPGDLSVVGFDDSPLARRVRPMLTTVRQDVEAKGKAATSVLLEGMARAGGSGRAKRVVLPTELVVRDSTAPPAR